MNDPKAHLKAMLNSMIEKNQDTASQELHAYLAQKMQKTLASMEPTNPEPNDD